MDKNGATKATYLDNLLNWTKPVSLRQIGTICWRLATILKLLSRKNTLHVIYSHFQQVKTQDESLTKYQGGSRQHHVGSWNIFDLGFSKLSPDFSSMFVEFQSKYHREEQIGAQIWLKSGDGIIQIAVFWHLQFALFLPTNNFFSACHPSFCSVSRRIVVHFYFLVSFALLFTDFCNCPEKDEGILQQFHFLFDLGLHRELELLNADSRMHFQDAMEVEQEGAEGSESTENEGVAPLMLSKTSIFRGLIEDYRSFSGFFGSPGAWTTRIRP